MNPPAEHIESRQKSYQKAGLVLFLITLLGVVLVKLFYTGWLSPCSPLELSGQPTLIFFTLSRGCECQMVVVHAAEAQLASWTVPSTAGIAVLEIDFGRHSGLARKYKIARAPALLLLNGAGDVVWKQDLGLIDTAPLDLLSAEQNIRDLNAERQYVD